MACDENDWNIPCSDDEDGSCKTEQGEEWEIPLKVLLLYSEIEKKGFLELKVKEFRIGSSTVDCGSNSGTEKQQQEKSDELDDVELNKEPETSRNGSEATFENSEKTKPPVPSAFDYTEEFIEESSLLTRKTPKSERFQRKRVGTLESVISDLKRFRDMDSKAQESGKNNNGAPEVKNKES